MGGAPPHQGTKKYHDRFSIGFQGLGDIPMDIYGYSTDGFPWKSDICKRDIDYGKGICPVAEELHDSTYVGFPMCLHDLSIADADLIVTAFKKVWANIEALK